MSTIPSDIPELSSADRLRDLLAQAGLSQRAAARILAVDERLMRLWCAGQGEPPESIFRALDRRLTQTEHYRRTIESVEKQIAAMQDGRITGMGYGAGPSDPQSLFHEIRKLQRQNEETRALLLQAETWQRRQDAFTAMYRQMLPHGTGVLTPEVLEEFDAADKAWKEAKAGVDCILQEIRSGRRQ